MTMGWGGNDPKRNSHCLPRELWWCVRLCKPNSAFHSELVICVGAFTTVPDYCFLGKAFNILLSVSSLSVTWTVIYKYTFIHSRSMHWVATMRQALCRTLRMLFWRRSMGPVLRVVMGDAGT